MRARTLECGSLLSPWPHQQAARTNRLFPKHIENGHVPSETGCWRIWPFGRGQGDSKPPHSKVECTTPLPKERRVV